MDIQTKPEKIPVDIFIPEALKAVNNWCAWKLERRKDRMTKTLRGPSEYGPRGFLFPFLLSFSEKSGGEPISDIFPKIPLSVDETGGLVLTAVDGEKRRHGA